MFCLIYFEESFIQLRLDSWKGAFRLNDAGLRLLDRRVRLLTGLYGHGHFLHIDRPFVRALNAQRNLLLRLGEIVARDGRQR